MATRRSSRPADDERQGRRSRRRASSTNWIGPVIVLMVIAALLAVAIIMAGKFRDTEHARDTPPATPRQNDPAKSGDEPASKDARAVAPDRPAPEVRGDLIIAADAIFREAKKRYAEAEVAAEGGDTSESAALMNACRKKFVELDELLAPYKKWLADAKQNNWEMPRTYGTIDRRCAKYDLFHQRVPPK